MQEQPQKPKRKGFLGIFGKKEKPKPTVTTTMLRSLDRDMITEQQTQSRRLSEHTDSLAVRNAELNRQLHGFIHQMDKKVQADLQKREAEITAMGEQGCGRLGQTQLCDEIGMMVVDEIFDGWKKKGANDYGGRYFAEWWKKDVEDWVRRDRNHPSIIMWSIGNETGTSDIHRITEEIHKYDKQTRPTSGGNVLWGTDVAGFTGQGGMPGALEKFHEENPERPIVLMEVPHTIQTRGFYRVPTWWRDKGGAVNEIEPYGKADFL